MKSLITFFTLLCCALLNAQTIVLKRDTSVKSESKKTVQAKRSVQSSERAIRILRSTPIEITKLNAAYIALQDTMYHLEQVAYKKSKASMTVLTSGWSIEDQRLAKRDLAQLNKDFKFEQKASSLIIQHKKETVEIEFVDVASAKFRINGKIVHITPYRRYEVILKEVENALNTNLNARFHLINLFIPQAQAVWQLAARVVVGVGAAAAKHPAAMNVMKTYVAPTAIGLGSGFVGTVAANKWAAHDFARNLAWFNPERVNRLVCSGKMSPPAYFDRETDCADAKKSDMEVELKQPEEADMLYAVPNTKMDKKCEKKDSGFVRDTGINLHKSSGNGEINTDKIEETHRLRFTFVSNPNDPKKLITKTMVETAYDSQGKMMGQRIWTFDGDDFVIKEYTAEQVNMNAFQKQTIVPTIIDCSGKKLTEQAVCKKLDKGLLASIKPYNKCNMDNAEQVIEQIKAEKKEEELQSGKEQKARR